MNNSVLNPTKVAEVEAMRARVHTNGLEAGVTGGDWSPQLEPGLRSELELLYAPQLPVGSVVSAASIERWHKDREALDRRRETSFQRLAARPEPVLEGGVMWRVRSAVATACLLGIAGLVAGWWGANLGVRGWVALGLVWALLQTRPWGMGEKFCAAAGTAFTGATYLYATLRSALLARRISRAESATEMYALRREQCQALVNTQFEFLLGQFQFAKARGERARMITQQQA